ncbi:hypothetical protein BJX66DRAFT_338367 [Aspergillus keveii]|uniref:Uncharacterized protein n=1 Tax=Aspergillus keveii TaxID=714993 RepID=A0ABR4G4M5_9EURO
MHCQIPDKMCSICQSKYTSLESSSLAHKRSPGDNIYQIIFTRYLYNNHTFAHLETMATNFARNIKSLSGIAVDPMLVGFPRLLLFPNGNQSERDASPMLDELMGIGTGIEGLPAQPVGTLWSVIPIDEKDGHHSLVRLAWLEEAVNLARGAPAHVTEEKLYGSVTTTLAVCSEEENESEMYGPFELPG